MMTWFIIKIDKINGERVHKLTKLEMQGGEHTK